MKTKTPENSGVLFLLKVGEAVISVNIIIARGDESGQARIIRDQMLCSVVESYRQEMIKIAKRHTADYYQYKNQLLS